MKTDKNPRNDAQQPTANDADRRPRNTVGVLAIVAVAVAVACAGFFGYQAYEAYFVQKPIQQARDEATAAAEQAMVNVTTIDPARLDEWQRNLNASFTGGALTQVNNQIQASLIDPLRKAANQKRITTGAVKSSAPTEVNADDGTAKVQVYVNVVGSADGKQSDPVTMGFLLHMNKGSDGTWKADTVFPLDGMAVQEQPGQRTTPSTPVTPPQGGGN